MKEQVHRFIEQTKQSIQSGQLLEAMDLIDQAIALEPGNSEAHGLRGIILSQLQRPAEATESLRRAVELNPASSKAHFNFAVHLFSIGDRAKATTAVREAVRLEPSNAAANELLAQLQPPEKAAPTTINAVPQIGPPPIHTYAYRPGYEAPVHSMQFVERLGTTWTILGWVSVACGAVGFILGLVGSVDMMSAILENEGNFDSIADMLSNQNSPTALLANLLLMITGIFGWVWSIMDITDRRANWVWAVPMVLCCCAQMHWLAMAIYILVGRKPS
ncbi:MAG TPA: tetratricopeptide repeat protein [Fimbriimonadaceae bacterium]|nr:tetratricopeptide repeat protein [Fimbriimonadaceae bacterium]